MGKSTLVALLLLVACGSAEPGSVREESLGDPIPSCSLEASPLCTGKLSTLECDRTIANPLTTECRHLTYPSTFDTVPCVHAIADNADCFRPSASDPLVWCCSIPE
jgi:hypothetical protein